TYSQFSDIGEFVITPDPPVLDVPAENAVVPDPVRLEWNPLAGAKSYRVIVTDKAGIPLKTFPLVSGTSLLSDVGSPGDTIYWKVSALDIMDNESDTSLVRKYIIE